MPSTKRQPRLRRSRSIRSFRLTKRDIEIIHHVFRHRFLRSSHICQLIAGSQQGILRRLQLLYHHGYLERPRIQIKYFNKRHNQPLVYGVARKGANILKEEYAIPKERIDWMLGKRTKALFLEHTLEIADFMVNLETKWIKETDTKLIPEEALQTTHHSSARWKVQLRQNAQRFTHTIEPDGLFTLKFPDKPNEEIGVILEVDRGTMPVTRKSLQRSSIQRKLLAYETLWKQGFFKQTYGWKRVRVLFVVTNPHASSRIQKISLTAHKCIQCHGLIEVCNTDTFNLQKLHHSTT